MQIMFFIIMRLFMGMGVMVIVIMGIPCPASPPFQQLDPIRF